MTPIEAASNFMSNILKLNNSKSSKYAKEFKMLPREKFRLKGKVYVEANLIIRKQKLQAKYAKEAEIYKILEHDSYLVK